MLIKQKKNYGVLSYRREGGSWCDGEDELARGEALKPGGREGLRLGDK